MTRSCDGPHTLKVSSRDTTAHGRFFPQEIRRVFYFLFLFFLSFFFYNMRLWAQHSEHHLIYARVWIYFVQAPATMYDRISD